MPVVLSYNNKLIYFDADILLEYLLYYNTFLKKHIVLSECSIVRELNVYQRWMCDDNDKANFKH